MMRILCILLVSNCLLVAQNASTPVTPLSRNAREAMVAAIADGNSLFEAGKTGDPALIPPLRAFATSRRADSFGQHQAVLALAKLGDQKAQQQIVCKFYGDDKITMQDAAETDLPYVGGWFAIKLYRYLLSPEADKRFQKAKETSDLGYVSPAIWSLMLLPKVVSNPPLPPFELVGDSKRIPQRDGNLWLDWIQEHQTSLQQLTPTGEGIDFSGKSCKHFKPYPHSKRE
jgi:hypothetical protein